LAGELAPERVRAGRDRVHAGRVRGVLVVLALALAGSDPEHEGDDDRDRECDEAHETCERDEPGRRLGRPGTAASLRPDAAARTRRLLRLRLVEEVELDRLVLIVRHLIAPDCNPPS